MADLAIRVDHCEEDIKEDRGRLDEAEGRLDTHSDAINGIEQWRTGNGAQGAEARLQTVEGKIEDLPVIRADVAAAKLVADAKLEVIEGSITSVLDKRDAKAIAKVKAWGPIVAAGSIVLVEIIKGILGKL
jgi:hypothetical protein